MNDLLKSASLPETIDPTHQYIYRTGQHGVFRYWYRDVIGNYWEYSNAPEDSADFDEHAGSAILIPDQPMPHTAPQYYSDEGYKLNIGVPTGMEVTRNENYDPASRSNIWFQFYKSEDHEARFVYLDSDVRESLDLWIQNQLRVTDAGIPAYREYAAIKFRTGNLKDKVIGALLMLMDQGLYGMEELVYASTEDIEFIDRTVKLLGRKFVCDPPLLDFLTSLVGTRDPGAPLFVMDTFHGKEPIGIRYLSSLMQAVRMDSYFLQYWHANHQFSRIIHRLALEQVPMDEVGDRAFNELSRVFATPQDISYMVDHKLVSLLFDNYKEALAAAEEEIQEIQTEDSNDQEADEVADTEGEEGTDEDVEKSLTHVSTDDFGIAMVWSDLTERMQDEAEFSGWLQAEPLHDADAQTEALVQESAKHAEAEAEEAGDAGDS